MNSLSVSRNHLESTFFRKITMNTLFASRFLLQFTIVFAEPLWIRSEITKKPLWNHYEFTIFAISLEIHCLFRKFTICFANFPWIHYLPRDFSWNLLSFSRIHYLLREFTLNPLSFFRNDYEFAMKSILIHYLFRELTIFFANSLSVSRIHLESTILFVESL